MTVEEYESVRSDAKQFVVPPDHFTPEIEELVLSTDAYWVVRKSGDAGQYVEQLRFRRREQSSTSTLPLPAATRQARPPWSNSGQRHLTNNGD